MSSLAAGTATTGSATTYPAKFGLMPMPAPDCMNDYVAFNTSLRALPEPQILLRSINSIHRRLEAVRRVLRINGPSVCGPISRAPAGHRHPLPYPYSAISLRSSRPPCSVAPVLGF